MSLSYTKEWLGIANRALNIVGESPLQEFEGVNTKNESINIQITAAVEEVLSRHNFKCATKRAVLSPDADETPEFEYSYRFILPENFCRLVRVYNTSDYLMEDGAILASESPLQIVYIELPKDPFNLTSSVREAISLILAYKIAMTTTTNSALLSRLREDAELSILKAIKDDKENIPPQNIEKSYWGDSR